MVHTLGLILTNVVLKVFGLLLIITANMFNIAVINEQLINIFEKNIPYCHISIEKIIINCPEI